MLLPKILNDYALLQARLLPAQIGGLLRVLDHQCPHEHEELHVVPIPPHHDPHGLSL
eukprot:m.242127 g.242127  ORF g.242127 m.242127 type:complete len:57 (-) comp16090_c0_seq2:926-1096(-)